MQSLSVAAIQVKSHVGGVEENLSAHVSLLEQAAACGCQLAVFPECGVTGYSTDLHTAAFLQADDVRLRRLEERAFALGMALCYGFLETSRDAERPFVTSVVASEDSRLVYRKTHLGSRERDVFAAGGELPVADVLGVRMGVMLCWEAHLPQVAGTLRAQGAQLVLAPHASGASGDRRLELWRRFLPARAYDNGVFVVACNALHEAADGTVRGGGVAAYAPDGTSLGERACGTDDLLVVQVGGELPRERPQGGMRDISYFDRRRPELYL